MRACLPEPSARLGPFLAGVLLLVSPRALGSDPVAIVAGRPIPAAEVEALVQQAASGSGYYHRPRPEAFLALRREKLDELVRRSLDAAAGRALGWELPLERARRERAALEARLGRDAYERAIAARSWTREDHAAAMAEAFLAEEVRRCHVEEAATVTPAEVRAEWDRDPASWAVPESLRLLHIVFGVPEGSGGADRWKEREREAGDVARRARQGESFEDLASKHSDDMYRIRGGDLGWVHRGRLGEPMESASWGARPGEVLGPLRAEDGFHVLKVVERRPARPMSFEEARGLIRSGLSRTRREDAERRWYAEQRARFVVEVVDPDLVPGAPE